MTDQQRGCALMTFISVLCLIAWLPIAYVAVKLGVRL